MKRKLLKPFSYQLNPHAGKRLREIPEDFKSHRSGRLWYIYKKNIPSRNLSYRLENLLRSLKLLPATKSRSSKIGTVWEPEPAQWGLTYPVVVRQYVHGGVFGKCSGAFRTLFANPGPMLNELSVSLYLLKRGMPTSQPVVLIFRKGPPPFFSAYLISKKIGCVLNMLDFCRGLKNDHMELPPTDKEKLLDSIASAVARLHKAGVYHGDLNLKNILLKVEKNSFAGPLYIIDFKKAAMADNISYHMGMSNLQRLWRSLRKWPESAAFFDHKDYDFLRHKYRQSRMDQR